MSEVNNNNEVENHEDTLAELKTIAESDYPVDNVHPFVAAIVYVIEAKLKTNQEVSDEVFIARQTIYAYLVKFKKNGIAGLAFTPKLRKKITGFVNALTGKVTERNFNTSKANQLKKETIVDHSVLHEDNTPVVSEDINSESEDEIIADESPLLPQQNASNKKEKECLDNVSNIEELDDVEFYEIMYEMLNKRNGLLIKRLVESKTEENLVLLEKGRLIETLLIESMLS